MAEHSTIEWTDATWNPVTGCSIVSPGCTNCYAMRLAGTRLKHHPSRAGLTVETRARGVEAAGRQGSKKTNPVWNGQVRLNEQWLDEPLRWKRPRRIFVCAHGDLFHEAVPDAWIDRVFAVMTLATQHTFQVLTKRSERMRAYVGNLPNRDDLVADVARQIAGDVVDRRKTMVALRNPLPSVWLGVSAERQQEADERIPDLLATPAAVRFLSAEPLLGPIDLTSIASNQQPEIYESETINALTGQQWWELDGIQHLVLNTVRSGPGACLDWVIAGGESGAGARPMHPDWARQLRDQCDDAGVPFFFKQWGEFAPTRISAEEFYRPRPEHQGELIALPDGRFGSAPSVSAPIVVMRRVGKKAAGRLLDGVEHNAMPEPRP